MQEIKLNRTDRRSLVFLGVEIASHSTKQAGSTRWTKTLVYRTHDDKCVVGLVNRTLWEGETDHYDAQVFDDKDGAVSYLERYAPETAHFIAEQLGVVEKVK